MPFTYGYHLRRSRYLTAARPSWRVQTCSLDCAALAARRECYSKPLIYRFRFFPFVLVYDAGDADPLISFPQIRPVADRKSCFDMVNQDPANGAWPHFKTREQDP